LPFANKEEATEVGGRIDCAAEARKSARKVAVSPPIRHPAASLMLETKAHAIEERAP
jgi:hypothetical protein